MDFEDTIDSYIARQNFSKGEMNLKINLIIFLLVLILFSQPTNTIFIYV